MRRRMVGLALAAAVLTGPATAPAQTDGRIYRLAHLASTRESEELSRTIILPELARLGFSEPRNLAFDARVGPADELPAIARALVATRPDALIAIGPESMRSAREATDSIPIVTFGASPIELGIAEGFARPGSNVTGVVILTTELEGKRLQLLHETVPLARRFAALIRGPESVRKTARHEMHEAAMRSGVTLEIFEPARGTDYDIIFAGIREAGADALAIGAHPEFFADAAALAAKAVEARLPTVCEWADMARAGCLLGYGPSRPELRRRVASLVARIFNGAAPADLPIERPAAFEFVVNLKTAAALGIAVPAAILARADEVIE